MSQPFEIDTDALGRAEAPFRELAQRLVALSDQVQSQVRGLGEVWGDDESGQGFAAQYGPARDELLTAFRSTGEVVTSTADGVRTMAQGFQRTEESNQDASSQLLRRAQAVEGTPLAPTSTEVSAPLAARRMRTDAEPVRVAAEKGEPAQPLEPVRAAAVRGEPAQPLEPVRTAAVRGQPAEPAREVRATAVRGELLEPTRVAAVKAEPAAPMVAGRTETVAAEPMQRAQAVKALPLEPMQPALPTEPVQPALAVEPVQPRLPLEPVRAAAVRAEAVRAEPLQPTSATRMETVPAEPMQPTLRTEPVRAARMEAIPSEPRSEVFAADPGVTPTGTVLEPTRATVAEPVRPDAAEPLASRVVEAPVVEPLRPVARAEADSASVDESQRS